MRRLLALLAALALAAPPAASAAAEWHAEQPVNAAAGFKVPLGIVGDVEFWAPNRGLLITGGNDAVPAGLYAYDGVGWYPYSTVCGGAEGRIAWVGPNEFWTVSDMASRQEVLQGDPTRRSLCHFKDGHVVASYAEPLNALTPPFLPMTGAACVNAGDCWFGGERMLVGLGNPGAFHLHWDGAAVTPVPALSEPQELGDPNRGVVDLAAYGGQLYESVQVRADDGSVEGEEAEPSFLHRIDPGSPRPFTPLFTSSPLQYGTGAAPTELGGFQLAPSPAALWGVAGGSGSGSARVTAVRLTGAGGFEQVALAPNGTFLPGDLITGAAAEPDGEHVWVSFRHLSGEPVTSPTTRARVARIGADGSVEGEAVLPTESEPIGRKGPAGPIACAAAEQCWMATRKGWLFHLGGSPEPNGDPLWHPPVIAERPCDDSCPPDPPNEPKDDSGAESEREELAPPIEVERLPHRRKRRPLVAKVHQKVLGGTLLQLSFVLHARAHVRLLAKHRKRVVAKTPLFTMSRGHHLLRLRLDPDRWPTSLDFQVHAVARAAR